MYHQNQYQETRQEIYYSLRDVFAVFDKFKLSNVCAYEAMQDILPIYYEAVGRNVPVRFSVSFTSTSDGIVLVPSVQVWIENKRLQ